MKKLTSLFLSIALCFAIAVGTIGFTGCGKSADLRIFNCYEYINTDLIDEFEEEFGVTVEYSCFDTPEDLYNKLKTGSKYDVVCPSDYMIEKMAREGMIEKINLDENGEYNTNVSPFVKEKMQSVKWGDSNENSLADYAAGYMWGTLGLVYNPATVTESDMNSWSVLWNSKYNNKFTIKDSVRDTYFIGLANYYKNDLLALASDFADNNDLVAYQTALSTKFNDTSANTVSAVQNLLVELKTKSFGMEVDSGKDDIIKGNTDIYFAWSGDAVYAMDEADALTTPIELRYSVPNEGSNIWFDGWCIPTGAQHKDLALEFIDFISRPENVIRNMEEIGYVSCVAGDVIYDWVVENYDESATGGSVTTDLSYFFGDGDYNVVTSSTNRQFNTQYPSKNIIDRCVLMNYFPNEANQRISDMWSYVLTR